MPSVDGDSVRERERSWHSKLPMWDSSDPDRNPPPLPLNPSASPTVRSTASASIIQAAQLFTQKAPESVTPSHYTTNSMSDRSPERSPERSLVKGAAHRRLQSVRDIRAVLDGNRTPERSPERAPTPSLPPPGSPETPIRETPSRRGSSRPKNATLGENTPPSATMLALQTMAVRDFPDTPLANISNGATPRPPQSFEAILVQISSLTSIATNLQKEMAHLTRRSKDNASDLMSLKDATNARDEDIRKSLKDLLHTVVNFQPPSNTHTGGAASVGSKPTSDFATHATPPSMNRAFTLPRIPSPGSLFDDGGLGSRIGSPNPYSVEGAASVAMLEKIIREMVTKDGQERLVNTLSQLFDKATKENSDTAKRVADLVEFVKDGPGSGALVCSNGHPVQPAASDNRSFAINSTTGALTLGSRDLRTSSASQNKGDSSKFGSGSDFINEELIDLLRKIKDSVGTSGGLINKVSSQQQQLGLDVMNMGRSLAQKIDEARKPASNAKAIEDGSGKQDVARIVTEGLAELRAHLDTVMREKRRESASTVTSRTTVDSREVYDVVKHALTERGFNGPQAGVLSQTQGLDKDSIVDAIKEAYEAYQPNIDIQQVGLERDEILQCLKEGLEQYSPSSVEVAGMNRAEIMETIHEAMQNFVPPRPINEFHEVRDEVLAAVRECLDEARPSLAMQSVQPRSRELDALPEIVADAVKTGLTIHGPLAPQTLEINADELYDAVTRALERSQNPLGRFGEDVHASLDNIISNLHEQFKEYSAAHGRDTEQVLDAMKDGQECLRADIEQYVDRAQDVTGKDEIIEEIRAGVSHLLKEVEQSLAIGPQGDAGFSKIYMQEQFERIYDALARFSEENGSRAVSDVSSNAFGDAVRGELDQLRDDILTRSDGHKEQVLDTVKIGFDTLEAKLGSASLDEIKAELERVHTTITTTTSVTRSMDVDERDDIHASIRSALESLKETSAASSQGMPAETFQAVQLELSKIVSALNNVRDTSKADYEELITTVRCGLDDLRGDLFKKLDNPDGHVKAYGEVLDAINENAETLKSELSENMSKPIDMTVCYDILETLKDGIKGLKTDIDALKEAKGASVTATDRSITPAGNEIVLVEETEEREKSDHSRAVQAHSGEILKRDDLQKMEVMLAALQVKVDAMDANITDIPQQQAAQSSVGSATKEDIGPMENLLRDMQATLDLMASRDLSSEGVARKEDTDAIETLLRNTKSQLEELQSAVQPAGVSNEQIAELTEKLETAMGSLSEELKEELPKKEDLDTVQQLLLDLKPMLDEVKSTHQSSLEEQKKALETSLDALQLVALEVKEKVLEMQRDSSSDGSTRADIEQLTGLLHDFRDSHDKLKDSYEVDIGVTAKAFDDRKQEADGIILSIAQLKDFLQDVKDEMGSKLSATGADVNALATDVNEMEQTIKDNFAISEVVKEIQEKMDREFERIVGVVEALKSDADCHTAAVNTKNEEVRDALVTDIAAKVDELREHLVGKYDEAKIDDLAMKADQKEILDSTKQTADDLRISVDTLGATMTGFKEDYEKLNTKISEDSQTVFDRIEIGFSKVDDSETRTAANENHEQTRVEVARVITAVDAIQTDITEYHPRFMVTLDEIREIVSQQFEHAKEVKKELEERDRAASETSRTLTEEIKTSFSTLPALMPAPSTEIEHQEKHDASQVHSKLDQLLISLSESREPRESTAQLDRLDKIHQQVMATAAEVSDFVNSQTRLITEGHESKEKEAADAALLLERRLAEKAHLENDVQSLTTEKESLRSIIGEMRAERDNLVSHKARLAADVSSLHTALTIRKDELHTMDLKADALERRILEGIMDQSRALLLSRGLKEAAGLPTMRASRAPSNCSHSTLGALPTSVASSGLNMALKNRPGMRRGPPATANSRRIMSLNQITHNTPTGAQAYRAANTSLAPSTGGFLKRSQSVRSQGARKTSWNNNAEKRRVSSTFDEEDKENSLLDDIHDEDESVEDDASSTGTVTVNDVGSGYADSIMTDDRRTSSGSALTQSTNEYFTESESDLSRRSSEVTTTVHEDSEEESDEEDDGRSDSVAPTVSEVGTESEVSAGAEHSDDEDAEQIETASQSDVAVELLEVPSRDNDTTPVPASKKLVLYARDTDSGLGSEVPTAAALSGSETDYFRRAAEDEASSLGGR